jgi:Outer membrane protein beta-barrel domain
MQGCKLRLGDIIVLVIVLVIALAPLQPLHAEDQCGDECKINSNLGVVINVPVNSTSQVNGTGWGTVAGAGYNFNPRQAVIGEFMWNRIYPADAVLTPLRAASQSSNLSGSTDVFALTANYRFELLRGRLLGTYLIGGGGWYFRNSNLSKKVTAGTGTVCTPAWVWWGFTCTSGTVTASQTKAGTTAGAFGPNAGIGTSIRVGEAPYRLYAEARYHYAPTKNISTQFIGVSLGIRY